MGSRIYDHIIAYRKAVEELKRTGRRKMSMILNVEHHKASLSTLERLRDEHWSAIQTMCGHRKKQYNRCNYQYKEWLPDCTIDNCPLL